MTPFMAFDRPVREAENRLERFNADRQRLLAEVERRVVARRVSEAKAGGDASLEYVLNDVAYCEIRRLEASKSDGVDRWRDLSRPLLGFLFSPTANLREGMNTLRHLDARVHSDGEIDVARACAERGTIVVCPT